MQLIQQTLEQYLLLLYKAFLRVLTQLLVLLLNVMYLVLLLFQLSQYCNYYKQVVLAQAYSPSSKHVLQVLQYLTLILVYEVQGQVILIDFLDLQSQYKHIKKQLYQQEAQVLQGVSICNSFHKGQLYFVLVLEKAQCYGSFLEDAIQPAIHYAQLCEIMCYVDQQQVLQVVQLL